MTVRCDRCGEAFDYDWLILRPEFKDRVEKMRQDAKDLGFMIAMAKDRLEQFMGVSE